MPGSPAIQYLRMRCSCFDTCHDKTDLNMLKVFVIATDVLQFYNFDFIDHIL